MLMTIRTSPCVVAVLSSNLSQKTALPWFSSAFQLNDRISNNLIAVLSDLLAA